MFAPLRARLDPWSREIGAFLRWWSGELYDLLPGSWRRRIRLGRDELVLQVAREACTLERRGAGDRERLATFACGSEGDDLADTVPAAAQARIRVAAAQCRRVLEMDASAGLLVRDITLPQAAADNLRRVLEYEMDRHTPFPASGVFFGWRILDQHPATAQIRVRLVVVPRPLLEAWLRRLESWDLYPDAVRPVADPDIDLLPPERRQRRRGLPGVNAWLGLVTLALAGLLVVAPWWMLRETYFELRAEVQQVQPQARQARELQERRDELQSELVRLPQRKMEYPPVINAANELARVLPDHAWLTSLQYADDRLVLHGQSDAASELIALIEGSDYFERTGFVAPISRDDRGREGFQLETRLRPFRAVRSSGESGNAAGGGTAPEAGNP